MSFEIKHDFDKLEVKLGKKGVKAMETASRRAVKRGVTNLNKLSRKAFTNTYNLANGKSGKNVDKYYTKRVFRTVKSRGAFGNHSYAMTYKKGPIPLILFATPGQRKVEDQRGKRRGGRSKNSKFGKSRRKIKIKIKKRGSRETVKGGFIQKKKGRSNLDIYRPGRKGRWYKQAIPGINVIMSNPLVHSSVVEKNLKFTIKTFNNALNSIFKKMGIK